MFLHCTFVLYIGSGEFSPRTALSKSLFNIYFFQQINSDSLYTPKLKLSLARIKENLIICENDNEDTDQINSDKVRQPQLSSIVNLSQPEKLHGLTERIVAVESLVFLGRQYESLKPYLEHLIGASPQRGFLHQFYMQTIASTTDLRKPVYMAVASQAFDVANILNLMNKVNWEVTDVMSQHSGYIDALLQVLSPLCIPRKLMFFFYILYL